MVGAARELANKVRDNLLTEQQKRDRANYKSVCELLMLVAAVAVAVSSIIFIVHPTFPIAYGVLTTVVMSVEVLKLAANILQILESAAIEALARLNRETLLDQLARNTYFIRSIDQTFQPDWSRLLPA